MKPKSNGMGHRAEKTTKYDTQGQSFGHVRGIDLGEEKEEWHGINIGRVRTGVRAPISSFCSRVTHNLTDFL